MDPRLQELFDHHDIRKLLAEYCHGCDRGDEVAMAETYAIDSWDDHGSRKMDGKRFSFETVEESLERTKVVSHQLGQSLIDVRGDAAGSETYFIATVVYPTPEGGEVLNQIAGRYVDDLVREDGAWRIKKRICVREWSISHHDFADWQAHSAFVGPQRGQGDEAYRVLARPHRGALTHSVKPLAGASATPYPRNRS